MFVACTAPARDFNVEGQAGQASEGRHRPSVHAYLVVVGEAENIKKTMGNRTYG